jgi:predicted kinase
MLIVFAGLPGTGKTTLARLIAIEKRAMYLRIDTIEQALRDSGMLAGEVGPAGYMAAYALAEDNLRTGHAVVADAVNPVAATRNAWKRVATAASSPLVEIEIVCSDPAEHRRRLETRSTDVPGAERLSWDMVQRRIYEPWGRPRRVLDTAGRSISDSVAELRDLVRRQDSG